jgi:OOP family OmpA-OmpF porin
MRFFACLGGPRRFASLSLLCAGLALAGCTADEDLTATGSPFSQSLFRDYTDLATQTAAAPAPQAVENDDDGFFSDLANIFDTGTDNPADAVADAFRAKANRAAVGEEPPPEPAPNEPTAQGLRARLVRAIAQGKDQFPDQAARAQADYDCWVLDSGASNLVSDAQACRTALNTSLPALENAARPAPPPRPAPVATASVAPPPSDYTVYFDLDSWTLTAEDLAVITNVINTARAGGQSHITIVGHTDTSGPATYNKRLSVRRANVVVEALVDLGARRAAIQASGVGENDLAVATGDNVKEAKNRRAVIGLQP